MPQTDRKPSGLNLPYVILPPFWINTVVITKLADVHEIRTHGQVYLDKFFVAEFDAETRPCVRTPSFHSLDLLES